MPKLYVDTGGFYAVADRADRHHVEASSTFVARGSVGDLITSDHVVVECWLLLRARLGRHAAMRFWDSMESGVVEVAGVTSEDFQRGRRIARLWQDQAFSLVDCTSFALMERLAIEQALAFDKHFRVYRYGPERSQAFTIIP